MSLFSLLTTRQKQQNGDKLYCGLIWGDSSQQEDPGKHNSLAAGTGLTASSHLCSPRSRDRGQAELQAGLPLLIHFLQLGCPWWLRNFPQMLRSCKQLSSMERMADNWHPKQKAQGHCGSQLIHTRDLKRAPTSMSVYNHLISTIIISFTTMVY